MSAENGKILTEVSEIVWTLVNDATNEENKSLDLSQLSAVCSVLRSGRTYMEKSDLLEVITEVSIRTDHVELRNGDPEYLAAYKELMKMLSE